MGTAVCECDVLHQSITGYGANAACACPTGSHYEEDKGMFILRWEYEEWEEDGEILFSDTEKEVPTCQCYGHETGAIFYGTWPNETCDCTDQANA